VGLAAGSLDRQQVDLDEWHVVRFRAHQLLDYQVS